MMNSTKELASPLSEYMGNKTFDNFQIFHDQIFNKVDMDQEVDDDDFETTGKLHFWAF